MIYFEKKGVCQMEFLCPVCGNQLHQQDRSFVCPNRHSFDIARQGYVNLLTVQQKHSLNPGDTREQVLSRRAFLEAGFYAPIAQVLCSAAKDLNCAGPILDVGCGEGWYSAQLSAALDSPLVGLDISKEAVRCAAAKYKNAQWICGSAARLPIADGSVGLVTSLFALTVPEEFKRVLSPNGYYFQVLAQEDHLLGLKSIIYPTLTHKEKSTAPELPGFTLIRQIPVRFSFTVEGEQVQNLLSMTPHVYRIGREGAERLRQTERLTDTASCILNLYRPAAGDNALRTAPVK